MISIDELAFQYNEKEIFKNTSVYIPERKVSVLLGCNGAGKSTLLKILTNNIKTNLKINTTFKKPFYLPQNPYYPKGISTFDYLSSVFFKTKWKWFINNEEKILIEKYLKDVELYDKKDLAVENLSGGELQKANIALALLSEADILLLDEPISNMDLYNQIKILKLLKKLSHNGITSLIIMHDLNLAQKYGDYFIGINNQKIYQYERDKFFKPETLNQIYNLDFKVISDGETKYVQIFD